MSSPSLPVPWRAAVLQLWEPFLHFHECTYAMVLLLHKGFSSSCLLPVLLAPLEILFTQAADPIPSSRDEI